MKWGIIYMAFGEEHFAEVGQSLATVRRHMPEADVTVYTDSGQSAQGASSTVQMSISAYDRAVHMDCLAGSPYETTLCLDTDTWICESIAPIADLMERFDIAAVHTPRQSAPEVALTRIPAEFRNYNAGVFFLKRNQRTDEFLGLWKKIYRTHQQDPEPWLCKGTDRVVRVQPALREAIFRSDVRILTLPMEYNFRVPGEALVEGRIKVLHGRTEYLKTVAEKVNTRLDLRFVTTDGKRVRMIPRRRLATLVEWLGFRQAGA